MGNYKNQSPEKPDSSSQVPNDEKKNNDYDSVAGRDEQNSGENSQKVASNLKAKLDQKYKDPELQAGLPIESTDNISGIDAPAVPVDIEENSPDDVPTPETDSPISDESKETKSPLPGEIEESEQDIHQESEESPEDIEQSPETGNVEPEEEKCNGLENEKEFDKLIKRAIQIAPDVLVEMSEKAFRDESAGIKQDEKEMDNHFIELKHWRERVGMLLEGLKNAKGSCDDAIKQSRDELAKMSHEIQESLEGRQKGLDLTNKMLLQQIERGETILSVSDNPDMELPAIGEQGWKNVVSETQSETQGEDISKLVSVQKKEKEIQRKLRDAEQKRYQVITKVREVKDKYRKNFLSFTGKQLLPVLDSLDDGQEHSQQELKELKAKNPDIEEQLDKWFKTYDDFRNILLNVLEKAGVYPMVVEINKPIQYDRHEPFDTESDPQLEDESIKSIMRKGYEYKSPDSTENSVLRPAQVIVVKNEKEENRG